MSGNVVELERWTSVAAMQRLADFVELLREAVEDGASVGFVLPLKTEQAADYWQARFAEIAAGRRVLLVAMAGRRLIGTVQLALESQPNGLHRAEVQRLLVCRDARRRGLGRALMLRLEDLAREAGRTLLILNTRRGDVPVQLYTSLGYVQVGDIPDFARNPDGSFNTTTLFYRRLD